MECRMACLSAEMLRFEAPRTVAGFDSSTLHYLLKFSGAKRGSGFF